MNSEISLGVWFARRAKRTPDEVAIVFQASVLSYGELQERIDGLARRFRSDGIGAGDRVAYLGLNHPAFLITLFASARLGAIFVPLNFRFTAAELEFVMTDASETAIVVADSHRAGIDSLVTLSDSKLNVISLADALSAPPGDFDAPEVDGESTAVIMYTSGTTGAPKGAMLSHSNMFWNSINAFHILDTAADDVTLSSAPLFHIGGLNTLTLITLATGGRVVLHEGFDPGAALRAIEEQRVTTMFGVPAMFLFMSQHPSFDSTDLSSLRMLMCGGAPCPRSILDTYAA